MALTLTMNGVDVTSSLLYGSLTVKANTADFVLFNISAASILFGLGLAVLVADSSIGLNWSGTVASYEYRPANEKKSGYTVVTYVATNSAAIVSNSAPFDLTDTNPGSATDLLTTEAGDELITETGTQHLMTEGPRSVAYQNFAMKFQQNLDGTTTTIMVATVWQPGLQVGQTPLVTCLDVGDGGNTYVLNDVAITWPAGSPVYAIQGARVIDTSTPTLPPTLRHVIGLP